MKIYVSIGEVVDKISILYIKLKKIIDREKLKNIRKEYGLLKNSLEEIGINTGSEEFKQLEAINLKLWNIENKIRLKEAKKEFDYEFIQLARSVYFNNDKRADVKRKINLKYGSKLMEEKDYVDY